MTFRLVIDSEIAAECCFVDVGQGTCNIVLLGGRRAIIIDCGPSKSLAAVRLLDRLGVEFIEALIISHNDDDHWGGAEQVLGKYPKAIRNIWFLSCRPPERNLFLHRVQQELADGNLLNEPRRIERPSTIYSDIEHDLTLDVLFPSFLENLVKGTGDAPNATSGVLALECGHRRIVFPGDLDHAGWKTLSRNGAYPVLCDVLAVPHHAGALTTSDHAKRHRWVYERAVRCSFGIISVGTTNQPSHPRPDHIKALCRAGVTVLCTQISEHCCDTPEELRPGLLAPSLPGESKPTRSVSPASGRSRHVGCAGTILVEVGPSEVTVRRLGEHQAAVSRLADSAGGHPLCRNIG